MSIFGDEMTQTCTLQAPSSTAVDGTVTYGSSVSSVCRSWEEAKILRLPDGEAIEYHRVLLLPETATVASGYKVTVGGRAFLVRYVAPVQLLNASTDHFRCYLGVDGAR